MKKKANPALKFKRVAHSEPVNFEVSVKEFLNYIEKLKGTLVSLQTHITGTGKDKIYECFIVYLA